jgi:hypothetical protein
VSDFFGRPFGGAFGYVGDALGAVGAARPNDYRALTAQEIAAWERAQWARAVAVCNDPALQAYRSLMAMNAWPMEPRREPGIHWTRTGGKTHRVEIVR